jgi:hypothetical protein
VNNSFGSECFGRCDDCRRCGYGEVGTDESEPKENEAIFPTQSTNQARQGMLWRSTDAFEIVRMIPNIKLDRRATVIFFFQDGTLHLFIEGRSVQWS